jgi:hypothetical protein
MRRVVCCGHRTGGALATAAAYKLAMANRAADVRCFTFCSPG